MIVKKTLTALSALTAAAAVAGCAATTPDTPAPARATAESTRATASPVAERTPTTSRTSTPPEVTMPCTITDGACADVSERKAWLLRNGEVVYGPVPTMPGKDAPGTATPTGTFEVSAKVRDYWSRQFDVPMPNSVFFYPGVAFHTGSLTKYSHGCIHLSPKASARFFNALRVGDSVEIVP